MSTPMARFRVRDHASNEGLNLRARSGIVNIKKVSKGLIGLLGLSF